MDIVEWRDLRRWLLAKIQETTHDIKGLSHELEVLNNTVEGIMDKDEKVRWLLKTIQERTHEIEDLNWIRRDLILELEKLEKKKPQRVTEAFRE